MNADALEDAMVAAVLAASGLPAGKVIWSKQGRTRPARPFIELDSQELPDNQHEEQNLRENPSPTADTAAVASLTGGVNWIFNPGSTITTVQLGGLVTGWQFRVKLSASGPVKVTWDGTVLELQAPPNTSGITAAAGLATWAAANPGIFVFSVVGNAHTLAGAVGSTVFTAPFTAGVHGDDFFLIDNVTHPEITIQLRCFSTAVRGSERASALLAATRKHLGGTVLTEQLDAAGIAVITRGTIQDVSIELQNEFEGRAVMALTIRTPDVFTESADRFDKVTVETTVDRQDGNPPVVDSITIDT